MSIGARNRRNNHAYMRVHERATPQSIRAAVSGGNFSADYAALIAVFKALPSRPKVYVMVPPALLPPYPYRMLRRVINREMPLILRRVAVAAGADGVIDVFSALGGREADRGLYCDGCHLNDAGYDVVASTIADTLRHLPKANLKLGTSTS